MVHVDGTEKARLLALIESTARQVLADLVAEAKEADPDDAGGSDVAPL
jgi:hypothetical protein